MAAQSLLDQAYLYHEQGQLQQAEDLYRQLLSQNPQDAHLHYNLGLIYQSQQRWAEAIQSLQSALEITPEDTSLYQELGNLWVKTGHLEKALECFQTVVNHNPHQAASYHNMGTVLDELKQTEAAKNAYLHALKLDPNRVETCFNLGNLCYKAKAYTAAQGYYEQALALNPQMLGAIQNLGNLLHEMGQLEQAIALFQEALQHHPTHAPFYNNLGSIYREQHKLDSALACFEKCLYLSPDYIKARINLADILQEKGNIDAAEAHFKAVLEQSPQEESLHMKLAVLYYREGLYEKTIAHCEAAIADNPEDYIAYANLGSSIKVKGLIAQSLEAFHKALSIKPDFWNAYENLLFTIHNLPGLSAATYMAEAKRYGQALTAAFPPLNQRWKVKPDPHVRLRIGYISPDFREHAANYAMRTILESHHHDSFEVVCFSHVDGADLFTLHYYQLADEWHFINGLTEHEVAQLIHQCGIHVLVDLGSGHTANNPLSVMAQSPAPIQFSLWSVSTGVPGIAHFVSDQYMMTPEEEQLSPEHIWVRQSCFLCFSSPASAPPVVPPPCLTKGYITFGSFNNLSKINPQVVQLWAQVMQQVPHSRLFLKFKAFADPAIRDYYLQLFAQHGIAPERLQLSAWTDANQHYALYHEIDIALDPFPFNGHTTTCEALWMGVPVVTLKGTFGFGRAGYSILSTVGFADWVASSMDEYVSIAVRLAHDPQRLASVRSLNREKMLQSLLCDGPAYVQELQHFYRQAWQQWCATHADVADPEGEGTVSPSFLTPQQARQYNTLGTLFAQQKQYEPAVQLFERALAADPHSHAASNNLGALWAERGELDKARQCYEDALAQEPQLSDIRFNLGNLYLQQGEWEKAVAHYEQVVLSAPLFVDAYLNLGNALRLLGHKQRAEAYYQLILRLSPEHVLAWVNLGSLYIEQNQWEQARGFLERALQLDPQHVSARRYLDSMQV